MDIFIRFVALTLTCLIVYLVLVKQNKDYSMLLTIAAVCMILTACMTYLQNFINFFARLESVGNLNTELTGTLFQAAGIGILSEICAMVCNDSGNSSLAKVIQLVATVLILYISLPLFNGVLDIVSGILGEI